MKNKRKCITTILGLTLLSTLSLSTPVLAEDSPSGSPIDAETILNDNTNESIYTPKEQSEAEKQEAESKPTEETSDAATDRSPRLFSSSQGLSSANQYIINQHYTNPVIEQQIKNFDQFVYKDGYGKPRGFVVHETANDNSTITSEINYMTNNWQNAFVHTFVDSSRIIQIHPTEYAVWGAGPKANPYFVQSELVREKTKEKFYKSINNDAYYVAYNLKQYGLIPVNAHNTGIGTVWSHDAVSRYLGGTTHSDPVGYFAKWGYTFNEFFDLVNYKYNELTVPVNKTYYAKSAVNLRATADWSSNIIINIPEGSAVIIDENSMTEDGFYKVSYGGKTGWMKLSYFSKQPVLQTYYAASNINLRKSASWDSAIVGTIPTNAKVTINNSTNSNGFYKVTYNDLTGWMKLSYFANKPVLEDVYAKSAINLRTEANWESPIAFIIKEGDKATLNNTTAKDGFYQITVNGKVGWMKDSYFSKQPVLETLYASSPINLRSKPDWNSSISATIPVNTQVKLNNTTLNNGFYQVTAANGKTGWMKLSYFSKQPVLQTYYAASNINLRKSASWDSAIVGTIPTNAKVTINNSTNSNGFYKVTYNDLTGWMKLSYFANKPVLEDVYAKSAINLRTEANWESPIAFIIKEGDKATLNNTTAKDGFYQITVNGKVGWMKDSYFSKQPVLETLYASSPINLRSKPDWNSSISATIPVNTQVKLNNTTLNNGFYQVTAANGKTGWMKLSYFSKQPVLQTYYAASNINLRKSASWDSAIVGTIPTNAKVTIDNSTNSNGFYKVTYNDLTGWMKLSYFANKPVLEDVYAKSAINLRTEANWESPIAFIIKEGDKATLNNTTAKDGFYQITVNGKVGWMKDSYFSKQPVLETLYASSPINLRSKPDWNSSISATIPVNTQVKLNNTTLNNGFYQVTAANGKTGWMKRNYFSTASVLETLYAANNVNLRQSPTWDSPIVVTIPKGAKVDLNSTTLTNDFYQITYNGKTGWMKRGYFVK